MRLLCHVLLVAKNGLVGTAIMEDTCRIRWLGIGVVVFGNLGEKGILLTGKPWAAGINLAGHRGFPYRKKRLCPDWRENFVRYDN